jgi:osmoprotectant transport system substrate-binding protein
MSTPATRSLRRVAGVLALGLVVLTLAGCGGPDPSSRDAVGGPCAGVRAGSVDPAALRGVTVRVGSAEYDEQLVLGQLTIKLLCAAGARVVDRTNTKGSPQTRAKLQKGDVDVIWDYTGAGWIAYLGHREPIRDPQAQYDAVKAEDLAKNHLVWGPLAPFDNTYAFAVTDELAARRHLSTSSDMATYLRRHPAAKVCVESEFAARPDGYPGFRTTYDVVGGRLESLGTGVVYTQLDKGGCDFGEVFTTDGRIEALGLKVLSDDRSSFPLYNGAPVVRSDFAHDHPAVLDVLAQLAPRLTTSTMTRLNKLKSVDGEDPARVATRYLQLEGLLR